jgi:hypothetical protein
LAVIEQIIQLATVDLKEADPNFHSLEKSQLQKKKRKENGMPSEISPEDAWEKRVPRPYIAEDILAGQRIQTVLREFASTRTHHGKGLTRACLTIGKTCGLAAIHRKGNQRPTRLLINLFVGGFMMESRIKNKLVLLNVFCQVHFDPGRKKEKKKGSK